MVLRVFFLGLGFKGKPKAPPSPESDFDTHMYPPPETKRNKTSPVVKTILFKTNRSKMNNIFIELDPSHGLCLPRSRVFPWFFPGLLDIFISANERNGVRIRSNGPRQQSGPFPGAPRRHGARRWPGHSPPPANGRRYLSPTHKGDIKGWVSFCGEPPNMVGVPTQHHQTKG